MGPSTSCNAISLLHGVIHAGASPAVAAACVDALFFAMHKVQIGVVASTGLQHAAVASRDVRTNIYLHELLGFSSDAKKEIDCEEENENCTNSPALRASGTVVPEHSVEAGGFWRACQTKDSESGGAKMCADVEF